MASNCVHGSGARRAGSGREEVKGCLIRFIADLSLRLVYRLRD